MMVLIESLSNEFSRSMSNSMYNCPSSNSKIVLNAVDRFLNYNVLIENIPRRWLSLRVVWSIFVPMNFDKFRRNRNLHRKPIETNNCFDNFECNVDRSESQDSVDTSDISKWTKVEIDLKKSNRWTLSDPYLKQSKYSIDESFKRQSTLTQQESCLFSLVTITFFSRELKE